MLMTGITRKVQLVKELEKKTTYNKTSFFIWRCLLFYILYAGAYELFNRRRREI